MRRPPHLHSGAMHDEVVGPARALVCLQRDVETAAVGPAQAARVRDAHGEDTPAEEGHWLAATDHLTVALAGSAAEELDRLIPA